MLGSRNGPDLAILRGNGDGTFVSQRYLATGFHSFIVTADLNRDGLPEILANGYDTGSLLQLENSNGSFSREVSHPVPAQPIGLIAADVNADGLTDLVSCATGLHVLLGEPDGSLKMDQVVPLPGNTGAALIAAEACAN